MFSKTKKVVATVLGVGMLFSSALALPVSAAEERNGDPVAISTLSNDWSALPAGESRWYRLDYDAIEENGVFDSEAVVELEMNVENNIGFEVYTAAQTQEWANGEDVDPIGVGAQKSNFTGNDAHDTKLLWANRTAASETFYIAVQNNAPVESYYMLSIFGKGASTPVNVSTLAQPQPVAQEAPAIQSATVANTVEVEAVEVEAVEVGTMGFGPDDAMVPNGGPVMIDPGETLWYTFNYDYDGDSSPENAIAELKMEQTDSIQFEVWTPDTVRSWANNDDFDPLGRGSTFNNGSDDEDSNRLVWVGSASASGKYYVLVKNTSDAPATYSLSVNGPTVSF